MFPRSLLDLRFLAAAALACAAVLPCACSDGAMAPPAALTQHGGSSSLPNAYRLGAGDKLKIAVYGEQDLSGQFEINGFGAVSMPLIGEVPARGRTVNELREDLTRRLSQGFLKHPKISIDVIGYRPIYVHGEVKNAGEFQYKTGVRMRDVIAMAGGYTYRAHTSYVLLTRDGSQQEYRVNLPTDTPVMPGDNIRVPERMF